MRRQGSGRGKRRILGLGSDGGGLTPGLKTLLLFLALGVLGTLFALSNPEASLRHLKVGFLSGSVKGNYFAMVDRIAVGAARRKGHVINLGSAGSVENVQRLSAARSGCSAHFALVQEGLEWPEGRGLELVGRLPGPSRWCSPGKGRRPASSTRELSPDADWHRPARERYRGLMRRLLAPLAALEFQVSTQPIDEQIQKLDRGELDLGAMVIDQDAAQLEEAIRHHKLQLLDLPRAEAVAHTLPFLRVGRIEAGHYDVVAAVPPSDKRVLQVDTLIVGNGCAKRIRRQGADPPCSPTCIPGSSGTTGSAQRHRPPTRRRPAPTTTPRGRIWSGSMRPGSSTSCPPPAGCSSPAPASPALQCHGSMEPVPPLADRRRAGPAGKRRSSGSWAR